MLFELSKDSDPKLQQSPLAPRSAWCRNLPAVPKRISARCAIKDATGDFEFILVGGNSLCLLQNSAKLKMNSFEYMSRKRAALWGGNEPGNHNQSQPDFTSLQVIRIPTVYALSEWDAYATRPNCGREQSFTACATSR